LFINTSGVGVINHNLEINSQAIEDNDVIIISGDIGRHGIAIMAHREGLEFETSIESDSAPLVQPILDLLDAGVEIHCLRDLTRGGLASALNEIAIAANLEMTIEQNSIAIPEQVQGACEILGFDPIYVANEGRFVAFVPEQDTAKTLSILQNYHGEANVIGQVKKSSQGIVVMNSTIGGSRMVDMLSGEQLPRIC
jgi:hydrogenase expression/formation protein HypE